jgi:CcmD family protein
MSEMIYLYVAYTVIWAGTFLYVLRLYNNQKKLRRELKMLKGALDGGRKGREKDI